jgi:predicted nucleic acid-binding protein
MTTSTTEVQRIFVDTSAWLALLNRSDAQHEGAVRFYRSLSAGALYVTTWRIVGETYTWLRYHTGYRTAARWLHEEAALREKGVLDVVFPAPTTEAGVRRMLSRFADQDLSYVDAFSLHAVQTRGNIDAVFAFDHHLGLTGLAVLPGPT